MAVSEIFMVSQLCTGNLYRKHPFTELLWLLSGWRVSAEFAMALLSHTVFNSGRERL
ncbi:MAG: hypothetical protein F6K28_35410 [Microcoleus sp. SIO2G3]|nr:hypothetical protein [Microcoleus sp. SIO2G3]